MIERLIYCFVIAFLAAVLVCMLANRPRGCHCRERCPCSAQADKLPPDGVQFDLIRINSQGAELGWLGEDGEVKHLFIERPLFERELHRFLALEYGDA